MADLSAGIHPASGAGILRGRDDERALLDGLLAGARAGRSGVLVLRGEAGVGKTALLEHALDSASDLTVARTTGVEAEIELTYAALQHLCAPLQDGFDWLPTPQRAALETAFGRRTGPAPDRFLVGLATLNLLSEAAEERPLVCAIDDAQWLDQASARVLAFVARRLVAEPVVLLVATREPTRDFDRLPELAVEGLGDADARALLASAVPGRLDERVADQLRAEARGNPLALQDLPRKSSPAQLAGGFGLLTALPRSSRIEDGVGNCLEALPADTQQLLLVAAAEPTGDSALLCSAARRLGIVEGALDPAESARLLEVGSRVRFRHPLVRSAVYQAATPHQRRLVHQALAEATDARQDPDRRAWHLAEATEGPDDAVADELEHAAGRAQARGGLAAAGAFLERAAALTRRPHRQAQRALAAAKTQFEAGSIQDALALLPTAEAGAVGDAERARVHLLQAQIAFTSRRGSDAPALLFKAARELEPVDPGLARTTYLEALAAGRFAGRLAREATVVEVSEAALAGPAPPQTACPPDLLLEGLTVGLTRGYAAGAPILKEALNAFRADTTRPPEEARRLFVACRVASDLWDDQSLTLLSAQELARCRETGALSASILALDTRCWVHTLSGELDAAAALRDEIQRVTEVTGIATVPYAALWVAALRGRETDLLRLVETTVGEAVSRGEGFAPAIAELASAALYNGLGRYDAALAAFRDHREDCDLAGLPHGPESELIEAAVRCGELALAERALERLAGTTRAAATDWALGIEARSRALLSDGTVAESLYREAIDRLSRTVVRLQLARTHLLYGEWLRRERHRIDARDHLRTALEMFTIMGADAFAGRAERELLATGERVRKRSNGNRDDLTTQEARVAALAREGLTNAEIGARLIISQHTVAYHLRKVFAKLDISSRNELGDVLRAAQHVAQIV
ncbi:MAG TPA: AAA family ATPase [Solirubrobacteraceae bacterium]|jgi:DNA-binding CsgD family transcriptional regulator|nr:AAA family ATPase [Solirubrobacteraceae bacterium]